MKTWYTDRSRIIDGQRCERFRWLSTFDGPSGIGIAPARKSLPLAVGGAVHAGLAVLLRDGQRCIDHHGTNWLEIEDNAVEAAFLELEKSRPGGLALDTAEEEAQREQKTDALGMALLDTAGEFGVPVSIDDGQALMGDPQQGQRIFEEYLWQEQSALVEGLVRAYARRKLRGLLERYEALEVEREGTWILSIVGGSSDGITAGSLGAGETKRPEANKECPSLGATPEDAEIIFMSRPDALLLERETQQLWLQSFKTAATWDIRKQRDAQRDMQGLSEGVEVERRLGEWWQTIHQWDGIMQGASPIFMKLKHDCSPAMFRFLKELAAPPRIMGIRYEYLLKGSRYEDKALSARCGFTCWTQGSHLTRNYVCTSLPTRSKSPVTYDLGSVCWSYEYIKEDGSDSKLYSGNWQRQPVWEQGTVREWIDKLDRSEETMSAYDPTVGQEPRPLGWKSDAQALGLTAQHPLDALFHPVLEVYRQEDEVRDWLEQTEAGEREIHEAVEKVRAARDAGERRSLLNRYFPESRHACVYPTTCPMLHQANHPGPCGGPADFDPIGSGRFREREPHHSPEREALAEKVKP